MNHQQAQQASSLIRKQGSDDVSGSSEGEEERDEDEEEEEEEEEEEGSEQTSELDKDAGTGNVTAPTSGMLDAATLQQMLDSTAALNTAGLGPSANNQGTSQWELPFGMIDFGDEPEDEDPDFDPSSIDPNFDFSLKGVTTGDLDSAMNWLMETDPNLSHAPAADCSPSRIATRSRMATNQAIEYLIAQDATRNRAQSIPHASTPAVNHAPVSFVAPSATQNGATPATRTSTPTGNEDDASSTEGQSSDAAAASPQRAPTKRKRGRPRIYADKEEAREVHKSQRKDLHMVTRLKELQSDSHYRAKLKAEAKAAQLGAENTMLKEELKRLREENATLRAVEAARAMGLSIAPNSMRNSATDNAQPDSGDDTDGLVQNQLAIDLRAGTAKPYRKRQNVATASLSGTPGRKKRNQSKDTQQVVTSKSTSGNARPQPRPKTPSAATKLLGGTSATQKAQEQAGATYAITARQSAKPNGGPEQETGSDLSSGNSSTSSVSSPSSSSSSDSEEDADERPEPNPRTILAKLGADRNRADSPVTASRLVHSASSTPVADHHRAAQDAIQQQQPTLAMLAAAAASQYPSPSPQPFNLQASASHPPQSGFSPLPSIGAATTGVGPRLLPSSQQNTLQPRLGRSGPAERPLTQSRLPMIYRSPDRTTPQLGRAQR